MEVGIVFFVEEIVELCLNYIRICGIKLDDLFILIVFIWICMIM